jgi:general secretion pathway protein L
MPGKILGIDISEDAIMAVQILGGLKGYQVTACAQVTMDEDGGVEETLKKLSEQMDLESDAYVTPIPAERASYRSIQMPFKAPKKIRQTLPFEMEPEVPFPISDLIVDFTMVDGAEESEVLGVSVKKEYIAEYLARLQAFGIDPEVLDIRCVPTVSWLLKQDETPDNGLFFEIGGKRNMMILFHKRHIALVRSFAFGGMTTPHAVSNDLDGALNHLTVKEIESRLESFCTKVQNTIHAFGWQVKKEDILPEKVFFTGMGALYPGTGETLERFMGIPVEQVNLRGDMSVQMESDVARAWNSALMDNALALALRHDRHGQGFNFRRGEFEVKKRYSGFKTEIRKVAIFLCLILAFLMVDLGVDYYLLKRSNERLTQEINDVFKKAVPDTKGNVRPEQAVSIIKGRIAELEASNVFLSGVKGDQLVLDLLKDISERIPQSVDLFVTRLVIDSDTVRIGGETDDFDTAEKIKSSLKPSSYFSDVTLDNPVRDRTGKRIKFELILNRTQ